MKKKIIVLGSGLVGAPISLDLAKDSNFEVTAVDIDEDSIKRLNKGKDPILTVREDLSKQEKVRELVKPYDIVVSAVPGFIGFQTLMAVIEAKKNVVDIAFFAEDPFLLDVLAKKNEVTAIVDCGVTPGMSSILVCHVDQLLDETHTVVIYVGGLPEVREYTHSFHLLHFQWLRDSSFTPILPIRFLLSASAFRQPFLSVVPLSV